jgi:DNA-binding ferritin-like protein
MTLHHDLATHTTTPLMAAVGVMRQSTDRIDECDAVTADLLRGIVATLEQQLWMIRVQAA